jgi:hypothetical protein
LAGAPHWLLWGGGAVLLAGRSLHLATLVRAGWGIGRAIGMILTFVPMGGFGFFAVVRMFLLNGLALSLSADDPEASLDAVDGCTELAHAPLHYLRREAEFYTGQSHRHSGPRPAREA